MSHYPDLMVMASNVPDEEETDEILNHPLYKKLRTQNTTVKQSIWNYYLSFYKTMSGIFDKEDEDSESFSDEKSHSSADGTSKPVPKKQVYHNHRFIVVPGYLYQVYD